MLTPAEQAIVAVLDEMGGEEYRDRKRVLSAFSNLLARRGYDIAWLPAASRGVIQRDGRTLGIRCTITPNATWTPVEATVNNRIIWRRSYDNLIL